MAPIIYASEPSQLPAKLADFILQHQDEALKTKSTFSVAVSGGSLVGVLREALVRNKAVKWENWHIYFADERLVEFNSPDSNYGLLNEDLLKAVKAAGLPSPKVYTIDESLVSDSQASEKYYSDVLAQLVPDAKSSSASSFPQFDLILLGCGPDGHTCSLFPGHALLKEKSKFVASLEDSPKPPPRRLTITLPVIAAANSVAFVAEGSAKIHILKQIFENPEKALPSSIVNEITKKPVHWFVDDSAVVGIKLPGSL